MFRNARFDKLLAKSTSELLMEADLESNLSICDLVRSQEVTPKYAITTLKKKLNQDNPHVLMLGLSLLEALMKNCGTPIHDEVLGTEFVMDLLEYTHINEEVRTCIFGFIQNWEFAFKKNVGYHYLHEAYNEIKRSGHPLPPFHESEAMYSAEVAPDWKDGDECFRCKSLFTTFRRKHHCRNCGNVFCGECTTGRAVIPKFGIEKDVRVCDVCLYKLTKHHAAGSSSRDEPKDKAGSHVTLQQKAQHNKEQMEKAAREKELRLREEEELQLALALSASEAESKKQGVSSIPASSLPKDAPSASGAAENSVPASSVAPVSEATNDPTTEVDPELAHYLNRNYWTNRAATADSDYFIPGFSPSAPPPVNPDYEPSIPDLQLRKPDIDESVQAATDSCKSVSGDPDVENQDTGLKKALASVEIPFDGSAFPGVPPLTSAKQEEFLNALRKSLDVFTNRMRVSSQRGRPIATDSTLQTLFQTLHQMHPQLLKYSTDLEARRSYLEKLQDQTTQVRESREALDALRRDYAEQRRREEEEAHRQRQLQMMQKVEVLRQQKRDAMEAQRRLVMEQTMAYQQQYGQYLYGQPSAAAMYAGMPPPPPPPMMAYGGSTLPPPPMGYHQMPDYYAVAGQPLHDPSVQQPPIEQENQQPPASNEANGNRPVASQEPTDAFEVQGMTQSLPPQVQPPPIQPANAAAPPTVSALLDNLPAPPSEELKPQANPPEEKNGELKSPTPQLICLE
uniref:Hepatocyte growth factor-regulated tyrosine kinase substrate n=2 Tax=Mesocestoides corti TaxID=53468 RepID=A0A5K3EIF7_MESCO